MSMSQYISIRFLNISVYSKRKILNKILCTNRFSALCWCKTIWVPKGWVVEFVTGCDSSQPYITSSYTESKLTVFQVNAPKVFLDFISLYMSIALCLSSCIRSLYAQDFNGSTFFSSGRVPMRFMNFNEDSFSDYVEYTKWKIQVIINRHTIVGWSEITMSKQSCLGSEGWLLPSTALIG